MVSIPDFSRWSRLIEPVTTETTQQKYERHRELESIKIATESGFLLEVTQNFLIQSFFHPDDDGYGSKKPSDIRDIRVINLTSSRIRQLGAIEFCQSLQFLSLANNYIVSIESLVTCRHLVKLDLKGNQIQTLPSMSFWSNLRKLRVLYLHDNPIGHTDAILGLSAARNLSVLTLYDSPLSLRRNYRHHVINSIWSLRVLDRYVISDEEIIEDADFSGNRFHPYDPVFNISVYRQLPKRAQIFDEAAVVSDLLWEINTILAHNSPVIIIQRYLRGYLVRRRYDLQAGKRDDAAGTIQKWWKDKKSDPLEEVNEHAKVPQSTRENSNMENCQIETGGGGMNLPPETKPAEGISAAAPVAEKSKESRTERGETFLTENSAENRSISQSTVAKGPTTFDVCRLVTPDLTHKSVLLHSPSVQKADLLSYQNTPSHTQQDMTSLPNQQHPPAHTPEDQRKPQPGRSSTTTMLHIDLAKLEGQSRLQDLDAEARALDSAAVDITTACEQPIVPSGTPRSQPASPVDGARYPRPRPGIRVKDVRQFFGPVVPVEHHRENDYPGEDIPVTAFRVPSISLTSTRPAIVRSAPSEEEPPNSAISRISSIALRGRTTDIRELDPVVDMIMRRAEAGRMIREAEEDFHRRKMIHEVPPQLSDRQRMPPTKSNDQRLFGRVQGTMGVLLLQKWDRMDRDLRNQEKSLQRTDRVATTRDTRQRAKHNIRAWQEDQRGRVQDERQRERRSNMKAVSVHKDQDKQSSCSNHTDGVNEILEREKEAWRRERQHQVRQGLQQGVNFAVEFRGQHNSVSKALMTHDRNALKEDRVQTKAQFVSCYKETEREQLDAVRKYLEHQRLVRQTEVAIQRVAVDSRVLQETNQRLLEAHSRVERLRALRRHAEELPTLTSNFPSDQFQPPLMNQLDLRGFDRFTVQALAHEGRIGCHPST